MSCAMLAKKTGLSMTTVQRVLSGNHLNASFANVVAIAEALGVGLRFVQKARIKRLREEQARQKAKRIVGLVQGTAGLEGQAVDAVAVDEMVDRTIHELLAGSNRKLWGE
jgi:transcriptional regulator with XRE-family HTH domain